MRISSLATYTRMTLMALLGAATFLMDITIVSYKFWVILFFVVAATVLGQIEVEWRYKEWLQKQSQK